ncbi:MAG TPA: glycerol-3-phosphate 1-O-acyltransferase PlsY [Stellaceae bacterium]|nr:glycerol-3-phosphate 1-O-acyltransferase PlsY [Stellaceae bacterium]
MPHPLGDLSLTWPFFAAAVIAYLLGSIPFGLVLTRLAGYGDIRAIGSGNIGATNVLRIGNKMLALLTVVLDCAKGAVAVLVGEQFGPDMAVISGAAVFLGHLFPPWLGFKGGKGVATAGGVLLAIAWPVGLLTAATWLAVAIVLRYSSLAALVACAAGILFGWLLVDPQRAELITLIAVLVVLRHHGNIRRLLRGEESKIKLSKG